MDKYQNGDGLCYVSKNLDIFRSPSRLFSTVAMLADTTGQFNVGNILAGSDGKIYGLGTVDATTLTQDIFFKAAPNTNWAQIHANKLRSGQTIDYRGFSEYKAYFYAFNQGQYLGKYDRAGVASADVTFINLGAFTNCAQPIVHPKDDCLYIPHDNKITRLNDATNNGVVLTLPSTLKITALSWYGNYLAIACSQITNGGLGNAALRSVVYLWDRDSSLTTLSESIEWGSGEISIMNNIDGVLMTVGNSAGTATYAVDKNSLQIKAYAGGQVQLVKEFFTTKQTTTKPSVTVNSRVDFVYQGKWYFSADIVGGSTSPEIKGLWALSKSKTTGAYSVCIENLSGLSVLAAASVGDFFVTVDTAVGTTKKSNIPDGDTPSLTYNTGTYESVINPNMPLGHYLQKKQLISVAVNFLALTTGQQVGISYRVDSELESAWTSIVTATTVGDISLVMNSLSDGTQFTLGRNYEFKLTTAGGAVIHPSTYKYELLETNI